MEWLLLERDQTCGVSLYARIIYRQTTYLLSLSVKSVSSRGRRKEINQRIIKEMEAAGAKDRFFLIPYLVLPSFSQRGRGVGEYKRIRGQGWLTTRGPAAYLHGPRTVLANRLMYDIERARPTGHCLLLITLIHLLESGGYGARPPVVHHSPRQDFESWSFWHVSETSSSLFSLWLIAIARKKKGDR